MGFCTRRLCSARTNRLLTEAMNSENGAPGTEEKPRHYGACVNETGTSASSDLVPRPYGLAILAGY